MGYVLGCIMEEIKPMMGYDKTNPLMDWVMAREVNHVVFTHVELRLYPLLGAILCSFSNHPDISCTYITSISPLYPKLVNFIERLGYVLE